MSPEVATYSELQRIACMGSGERVFFTAFHAEQLPIALYRSSVAANNYLGLKSTAPSIFGNSPRQRLSTSGSVAVQMPVAWASLMSINPASRPITAIPILASARPNSNRGTSGR